MNTNHTMTESPTLDAKLDRLLATSELRTYLEARTHGAVGLPCGDDLLSWALYVRELPAPRHRRILLRTLERCADRMARGLARRT